MRDVKLLKQVPWLVLSLLWIAGTVLWLLFVGEQQSHLKQAFASQLERAADELFRGRLEGRLDQNALPEGIAAFAVYDAEGQRLAAWGTGECPPSVDPATNLLRTSGEIRGADRTLGLFKALQPLRPRMGAFLNGNGEDDPDDRPARGPMAMKPGRIQGFLFVSVPEGPREARLWAWTIGGAVGSAAWAGFVTFVGLLWFRTRRFQEALTQHRELLQFAEASRTLGHELQNPLAAILLQTALLKRQHGPEVPSEVILIEEEARRMSGLVARVRDFLKDPKGQAEVLDLAESVEGLRGRFAGPVAFHLEGPAPFRVRFDAYRLRSVVENLLKNAFESGPDPRPEARLSRPKAGWIRLDILDSGRGFTPESLKQARDPFFTTKETGSGVGLSIAESFVQAAGGRLKLENRPEGGARISLDLPEVPQESAP